MRVEKRALSLSSALNRAERRQVQLDTFTLATQTRPELAVAKPPDKRGATMERCRRAP
jgi:hypothetical protein